jgi:hypothetical protein
MPILDVSELNIIIAVLGMHFLRYLHSNLVLRETYTHNFDSRWVRNTLWHHLRQDQASMVLRRSTTCIGLWHNPWSYSGQIHRFGTMGVGCQGPDFGYHTGKHLVHE